jgi:hypothetical protein
MRYQTASIAPDVFHVYDLLVENGAYSILIDGEPVYFQATGQPVGETVKVQFGFVKDWAHIPTQSEWDYVRITPEPASVAAFGLLLALGIRRRTR